MACVLTGCHPDNPLETTRQMTLTAESDLSRDGSERLALTNESLCVANSDAFQIGVRRHSDISPKCPQEIVRTERDLRCKLIAGAPFEFENVPVARAVDPPVENRRQAHRLRGLYGIVRLLLQVFGEGIDGKWEQFGNPMSLKLERASETEVKQ